MIGIEEVGAVLIVAGASIILRDSTPLLNAENGTCRAEEHIVMKALKEHAECEAKQPVSADAEGSEAEQSSIA